MPSQHTSTPHDTSAPATAAGAFVRNLPRRVEALARRIQRLSRNGWDINALSLLRHDARRLAEASIRHGLDEVGSGLQALERLLHAHLDSPTLPAAEAAAPMLETLASLRSRLPQASAAAAPTFGNIARVEVPPPGYWRRWVGDAPPPVTVAVRPSASAGAAVMAAEKTPGAKSARAGRATDAEAGSRTLAHIFHLTDGGALSCELDQRLEAAGYSVEPFTEAEPLRNLLDEQPPLLVVVDSAHIETLEAIGAALRAARQRTGLRLPLATIAAEDDLGIRLTARRAGADALIIAPPGAGEALQQLHALLEPPEEREPAYRVLIVEDDRSQGLFAESILRNAGMETRLADDPLQVPAIMEEFAPDLLLMDLHMPGCNGMELTALIRERDRFLHTPIVFLSGESDQDLHFEALDAGGDDFLAKPVRPRHLISAVQNRIRRARALAGRALSSSPPRRDDGLLGHQPLLARIDTALASRSPRPAGVLFIDIEGGARLREQFGLAALERLIAEAGTLLAQRLGKGMPVARYGDASFIVFAPEQDEAALEPLAVDLRRTLGEHSFQIDRKPVRLRALVGACALASTFPDASTLLNAAERACHQARGSESGVRLHRPQQHPELAREKALLALIERAIAAGGFELQYQPIVAVQGGDEAQYQALLRLRDDAGGLHPAAELIPLAERHGLMVDIDRWVMEQALAVLERSRHTMRPLRLFVSQSALTLAARDQIQWLRERMRRQGAPASALVIEIRLDDAILNTDSVQAFCAALVADGVQFCLSQCEGGSDGLALLERLPLGYVKLAPKYLAASGSQAVRDELKVLIDHAHRRNLLVIGHRVEDPQAAATLWVSGIDFLQGNLVQQAGDDLAFDFQSAVL